LDPAPGAARRHGQAVGYVIFRTTGWLGTTIGVVVGILIGALLYSRNSQGRGPVG